MPSARCAPIERRRRPTCTGRGSLVVGQRVQVPPGRRAEHRHQRRSAPARRSRRRVDAALVQLGRRHRADAPQPLDRQRVQERQLALGGTSSSPSGLATPLATLARNFVRAMPTVIAGRRRRAPASQPHRDLDRRARTPPQPADVEERLVDRDALDERRGVLEDREHRLARLDVRVEPRRHHDRLRAQLARLPPAHRRADAERLRLVARGQHHAAADDRPAGRAAAARRAARPTRRTSRGRRAGSRTHVRLWGREWQGRQNGEIDTLAVTLAIDPEAAARFDAQCAEHGGVPHVVLFRRAAGDDRGGSARRSRPLGRRTLPHRCRRRAPAAPGHGDRAGLAGVDSPAPRTPRSSGETTSTSATGARSARTSSSRRTSRPPSRGRPPT